MDVVGTGFALSVLFGSLESVCRDRPLTTFRVGGTLPSEVGAPGGEETPRGRGATHSRWATLWDYRIPSPSTMSGGGLFLLLRGG